MSQSRTFTASLAKALSPPCAGFAAGKLGFSEQYWLHYPRILAADPTLRALRAYELGFRTHMERQSGLYPPSPGFAREFVARYVSDLRTLDVIGTFGTRMAVELARFHELPGALVPYTSMEPNRSVPADDSACWLPLLRGRRVLIVAPFADLLCERATQDTFERVWSRIGKRWFHPAQVESVEFPYGFDPATQARYPTALDLCDLICGRIDAREFDVALIAAGGLAIPLAAHIKRSGRIGISLGGHLQVLFGVLGQRWRVLESWSRHYFNDAWIDMPERYRPPRWQQLTDGGAYW
jgi:hypothetical protein